MTNEVELEQIQEGLEPVSEAQAVADDDIQKPVFNQIQMQDVVKREKQKAYERGKREALMELQQQQSMQQEQMQQPVGAQSIGGMQQMSPADIERMIAEKAPQMLQDHVNKLKTEHVVSSFVNKMQAAESKYPGIQEKLNDLDYNTLAPIISLANDMENTADIMKELIDNPMKMGNLMTLMYGQPKLAQKAMQDLSSSIKQNQDAIQENAQARDPMSQLKPSTSAGIDNGDMSVNDFRKMFRSRK